MKLAFLIFTYFLFSCNLGPFEKDNEPNDPDKPLIETIEKADKYADLFCVDGKNAIVDVGDAMLFTSLSIIGGCDPEILWSFESEEKGRWCRHPDCPNHDKEGDLHSASRWSKDMETGLIAFFYHQYLNGGDNDKERVKEALKNHIKYGEDHNWDLCGENGAENELTRVSRCVISTNLRSTLYELNEWMGGNGNDVQKIPQTWNPFCVGFECHLTVVHWLVRGSLQDGINDLQLKFLKELSDKHPNNALYSVAKSYFDDGDFDKAISFLRNETYFPNNSLPTTDNYCTEYLFQRDERRNRSLTADANGCIEFNDPETKELIKECNLNSQQEYSRFTYNHNWLPCPERKLTHSSTDYRFTVAVMKGILKRN